MALQEQAVQQQQAALDRQQAEAMAAKKEMEDLRTGQAIISIQASQAQGMAQRAQQQIQQMQMDASVREGEEINKRTIESFNPKP